MKITETGKYLSTKTLDLGLSACFRQWRSTHSHCQFLHGYDLVIKLVFGCSNLDERNWVQDFGGLKPVKEYLKDLMDHKTLVAKDDPLLDHFKHCESLGMLQLRIVDNVGCEAFAKLVFDWVDEYVKTQSKGRVWLESCEVREHVANSAIYQK